MVAVGLLEQLSAVAIAAAAVVVAKAMAGRLCSNLADLEVGNSL